MCLKLSFPASILQNSSSTNLRDLPRCFQTSAAATSDLSDHVQSIIVNKSTPNSNSKSTSPTITGAEKPIEPQICWANFPARYESFWEIDVRTKKKKKKQRSVATTAFHRREQATAPYCEEKKKKKKKKKKTAEKAKHLAASLSATPCHTLVIK